eukprot:TRINITY_DN21192_c0_g1_i1.p1 TRINITY_DN21192_c0_g1~~TRINITY_DN21192_c0_g1_i1.p1  ORF type:complete len:549 (-),score=118.30 TRINITY_DN21192_c0_g1_i1:190-1836(-)
MNSYVATCIFSIVLRTIPVHRPDRLVAMAKLTLRLVALGACGASVQFCRQLFVSTVGSGANAQRTPSGLRVARADGAEGASSQRGSSACSSILLAGAAFLILTPASNLKVQRRDRLVKAVSVSRRASDREYDPQRAVDIVEELAARAGVGEEKAKAFATDASSEGNLKQKLLEILQPYGSPALNVPATALEQVEAVARGLEKSNPIPNVTEEKRLEVLDGTWDVRFSTSPPPSNGALGPFVGKAKQVIDVASNSYVNELDLGLLKLALAATYEPSGPASLRVRFRSLTLGVFGAELPAIDFPEGTERTWLLTYNDSDLRLVRAGVDGGRSTARDIGLLDAKEGEAPDSYLFVLTKTKEEVQANREKLKVARKARLLELVEGQNRGADATKEDVATVKAAMEALAAVNPTEDPASSALLEGSWEVVWTTESELLALTNNGFFGLPCLGAYQGITKFPADEAKGTEARYELSNRIDFDGGFLNVESTCEPAATGGKIDFRFESCTARWNSFEVPLPPVGSGWFEVLYIDDELRLARDSRGDLQILKRRKP